MTDEQRRDRDQLLAAIDERCVQQLRGPYGDEEPPRFVRQPPCEGLDC